MSTEEEVFAGIVGIDLGTTYSCVAVHLNGQVQVIANDQGHRTTPSRVAFASSGQILVGDAASNFRGEGAIVYDAKRLIGRQFKDKEVQDELATWPFAVRASTGGATTGSRGGKAAAAANSAAGAPEIKARPWLTGDDAWMAPEQVSAVVLAYLKQCAERFLGKKVRKAVVTVPAYFNDAQREHTRIAGVLADLEVVRIVNEPTAAALAYGLDRLRGESDERWILVFDFGGGTFDVSVVQVFEQSFMVVATAGHTHLGGQDIDRIIVDQCLSEIKKKHNIDLSGNARAVAKLRVCAERAKRTLSASTVATIDVDGLLDGADFSYQLTRAKLDSWCAGLYAQMMQIVQSALTDAKKRPADINNVVMVGGSTRIPKVQQLVSELFGGRPLDNSLNPDEAIAIGAAVQASVLSSMPEQKAAHIDSLVLMDVVPLSIGIDINDGKMDVLIPRNSTIPRKVVKEYTTVEARQKVVTIAVYEGERPLVKQNRLLGSFDITGITLAPKGVPTVVVELSVDANGILSVKGEETLPGGAKKSATARELVVQRSDRYSTADVEKMVATAKDMAARDAQASEALDLRNAAATEVDEWLDLPAINGTSADYVDSTDRLAQKLERFQKWLADDKRIFDDKADIAKTMRKIEKYREKYRKKVDAVVRKDQAAANRGAVLHDDDDDEREASEDGDSGNDDDSGADDDDDASDDEPPKKKRRLDKTK